MGGNHAIENIVLFDGVCNLCSASVRFIIERDTKRKFQFASLQSDFAKNILTANKLDDAIQTMMLLKADKIYRQSDAALEICKELSGLWPSLYLLKIVPRFIRNGIYNFISLNRYRWFGKTDRCWLPSAELKSRFI